VCEGEGEDGQEDSRRSKKNARAKFIAAYVQ